jgi:SAM-dependent MidA family methyltransferase
MARANAAYYARHDPYADFTTAPEISQVFGEILGLWAAVVWQQMGAPDPVIFAEAGPGRGTLMADALRAIAARMPAFSNALRLHLVETSPRLRAIQAARLPACWVERVEALPDGPLILLGNEFLDALPIRQFVRGEDGWRERHVADAAWVALPCAAPAHPCAETAAPGNVVEVAEAAAAVAAWLGRRFAAGPGAALFLDYGSATSAVGDSLQALRDRRAADPLAAPGEADLTAHVDFAAFARAAAGAAVHGPVAQGRLLTRLGLFLRSDRLARGRPPAEAAALIAAAQRLALPERMGRLFKAVALCHPAQATPPGFEP